MPNLLKPAKRLTGIITLPGDKSISHRALMIGAIARGTTRIENLLDCDDCRYTASALASMGVAITQKGTRAIVEGKGLRGLSAPEKQLEMGNSGTSMRLLAGILAGQSFEATLGADEGLSRRPMKRIIAPLSSMGVSIRGRDGEYPPLIIRGGAVAPIAYASPIASAQVKSAVLFAGLYADGITKVTEPFASRDHTERMLKYFGAKVTARGPEVTIRGPAELTAVDVIVPGDISSAAFFLVGATIVKGSAITIKNVGINPTRTGILDVMRRMGAKVSLSKRRNLFEPIADIKVVSAATSATIIEAREIPSLIDELPVIFVLAAFSKGKTVIRGARELRVKETDRIASMKANIEAMGGRISSFGNDIAIEGVDSMSGARMKSFGDHRTCMSMAIATLAAKGESSIDDIDCVGKSFPTFFETLKELYAA